MMMTRQGQIVAALNAIRPGAAWTLLGDDDASLIWSDENQTRPTWNEILAAMPVVVPDRVSPWQARAALLNAGLLDAVNSLVAQQPIAVQMKWDYAQEIRRDDPLILSLAGSLNLTAEQLDALFIQATTYT